MQFTTMLLGFWTLWMQYSASRLKAHIHIHIHHKIAAGWRTQVIPSCFTMHNCTIVQWKIASCDAYCTYTYLPNEMQWFTAGTHKLSRHIATSYLDNVYCATTHIWISGWLYWILQNLLLPIVEIRFDEADSVLLLCGCLWIAQFGSVLSTMRMISTIRTMSAMRTDLRKNCPGQLCGAQFYLILSSPHIFHPLSLQCVATAIKGWDRAECPHKMPCMLCQVVANDAQNLQCKKGKNYNKPCTDGCITYGWMWTFQTVRKISRLSRNYPDCPKISQTVQLLPRRFRNFKDSPETFQTIRKIFRMSRKFRKVSKEVINLFTLNVNIPNV